MRIQAKRLECNKCGKVWRPRKDKVYQCPKCKSFEIGFEKENKE